MDDRLKSLYSSLLHVLKNEIKVYSELHRLFLNEKEFIINSSADKLYENTSKKETCILKAKILEEVRSNLVKKIVKFLGIDGDNINLSVLLSYSDDVHREELRDCQSTLYFLLTEISQLNETNKLLLDSSLIYIQKSIDFINQFIFPGSSYLNTGKLKMDSMNGKILSWEG